MLNSKYSIVILFLFWHFSFADCILPVNTKPLSLRTTDELFASLKSKSSNEIYIVYHEVKYRIESEYAKENKSGKAEAIIDDFMIKCTEIIHESPLDSVFVEREDANHFDDTAILPIDTLFIALEIVSVGYAYGNKTALDFVNDYLADYISNSNSEYLKKIWKNMVKDETNDKQKFDGYLELKNNHEYDYLKNRLVEIMRNRICLSSAKAYGFIQYMRCPDEYKSFWIWLKEDVDSVRFILNSIENNFFDKTPDYAYRMQNIFYNIYCDLASDSEIQRFTSALLDNPKTNPRLRSQLRRYSISKHDDDDDDDE